MLWDDLRLEDAGRAYEAVWTLVACPEQAVPYLGNRMQPASPPDHSVLSRDLAGLGDNRFDARQRSFQNLKQLGDLAVPALRRRLANNCTLEEQRRIDELLRAAKKWSPNDLQILRAIQVLEYVGKPTTMDILQRIAAGAPESRLTMEAQASLARLTSKASRH